VVLEETGHDQSERQRRGHQLERQHHGYQLEKLVDFHDRDRDHHVRRGHRKVGFLILESAFRR
jgi:hypothetical protein